jgi:hypothetical protein
MFEPKDLTEMNLQQLEKELELAGDKIEEAADDMSIFYDDWHIEAYRELESYIGDIHKLIESHEAGESQKH